MTNTKLKKISADPVAAAKAGKLVYVKDTNEGYKRIKHGKGFQYLWKNKPVKDIRIIKRIKALVVPPAWKDVWICRLPDGHLQATGKDAMNRKQYRYHSLWNQHRNHTKFHRMLLFGNMLSSIRKKVKKDLALPEMPKEKVLALVLTLMDKTSIRIGNDSYEKLYGSFGLSTFKDKHASIQRGMVEFHFKGKKGVTHTISLKNKKLSKLVQQCRDIPGKELFQYYDEEGKRHAIDSGMVNEYIHNIAGTNFSSKDFRTWTGTVQMLCNLQELTDFEDLKRRKKNVIAAIEKVSGQLGNTPAVCKKYYIHPVLIDLYENKQLEQKLQLVKGRKSARKGSLSSEEKILVRLLENIHKT